MYLMVVKESGGVMNNFKNQNAGGYLYKVALRCQTGLSIVFRTGDKSYKQYLSP